AVRARRARPSASRPAASSGARGRLLPDPRDSNERRRLVAYINIPEGLAGILGPLAFRPETAKPLGELTDVLLRGPNTLSRAEREMIAARVSWLNRCHFCHSSHAAIAASHLGGTEADFALIDQVARDPEGAPISAKMKALLAIASLVA